MRLSICLFGRKERGESRGAGPISDTERELRQRQAIIEGTPLPAWLAEWWES